MVKQAICLLRAGGGDGAGGDQA